MKKLIYLIPLLLNLSGCEPKYPYPDGFFPEQPVNFRALNSTYDDMNSDLKGVAYGMLYFTYSSNSESRGQNFSLKGTRISSSWNMTAGSFSIQTGAPEERDIIELKEFHNTVNSSCNQKGPYSFDLFYEKILMYSSDCNGADKINVAIGLHNSEITETKNYQLNLFQDESVSEMYPSFYGKNLASKNELNQNGRAEKMIFASNKEGVFNLYEIDISSDQLLLDFLKAPISQEPRKLSISSDSNDHSPFVLGNTLVFASDRSGGLGGYDLYSSTFQNGAWSAPENMGSIINSEYDEFRPIIDDGNAVYGSFRNNLLIFSSNRPGGLGGYDLYYVGVPK